MPTIYFTFCTFDAAGESRSPARLIEDVSTSEKDMLALIETAVKAMVDGAESTKLVLSIDDPNPVVGEYLAIGPQVGLAQLRLDQTQAALVLAAGAGGRLASSVLRELQQKLADSFPDADTKLAFDWLTHSRLPVAATIYLQQGEPKRNLDRVAMCVATAFFRVHSGYNPL